MRSKTVYQTSQTIIPPRVILFVLFLAMLWGGNAVSLKIGLQEFSPFASAGLRFTIGLVLIASWASANRISIKPQRHEYLRLFLTAILFITQIAALNVGADFTRAGRTAVMTNTYPLFVALIAHFVVPGDHMTRRKALGLAFAFGGVCFVFRDNFTGGTAEFLLGDLLTLLGGFLLGLLIVVTNRLIQNINTYCVLVSQMVIGVPVFFTLSAIFEGRAGYGFSFPALFAFCPISRRWNRRVLFRRMDAPAKGLSTEPTLRTLFHYTALGNLTEQPPHRRTDYPRSHYRGSIGRTRHLHH